MERAYNIDIHELEEILNILYSYDDNEDVIADITTLETAIGRLKNSFYSENNTSTLDALKRDASILDYYRQFYPYVKRFSSHGMYFSSPVSPLYEEINLSHNDTLSLAHDFYHNQGSYFGKTFDEFYNEADNRLMFFEPNSNSDGEIFYLRTTGDVFVNVPNYGNFTKATILLHELQHMIDCFNNGDFYKNLVIREIASMFMELIGCNYIASQLKLSEDHLKRRFAIHSIVKSSSYDIFYKAQLLSLYKANPNIKEEDFIRMIDKKLQISEAGINYFLSQNIAQDYYYQISYMVAIELYTLYQVDPERALFILIDITNNATDDNIFDYLKKYNIVLCKNLVDYEDKMCLELKI